MKSSDNNPDKRRQRRDEAADAEVLSRILDIIGDMPAYGYRRVWAILRRQSRNEGLPFVNAKRVYRIMSENSLLLLHDKPSRPQREHKGRIIEVARRNTSSQYVSISLIFRLVVDMTD